MFRVRSEKRLKDIFSLAGWFGVAVTLSACGSGNEVVVTPSAESSEVLQIGSALPVSVENPEFSEAAAEPGPLVGVFLDSPVSNLSYSAGNYKGKTNGLGEFRYRVGDNIIFSIGKTQFPEIQASEVITPLDLFNTRQITHIGVTNVSRLLQTLDADVDPDNGIQLRADVHEKLIDVEINLTDFDKFNSTIENILEDSGVDVVKVVDTAKALTHLSHSLLENNLIDLENYILVPRPQ